MPTLGLLKLTRLERRYLLIGLLGMTLGVLFWGGFNWTVALTNSEAFCISCHEMQDNVYQEYKHSVHYKNASGVATTCPDCHVPKQWTSMMIRKVKASNELFHHFMGSVDSREKFENKRQQLAQYVWTEMAANDSLECRNCHQWSAMLQAKQRSASKWAHNYGQKNQATCIDCHKGIAHQLPSEFVLVEHQRIEQNSIPCASCHAAMFEVKQQQWD